MHVPCSLVLLIPNNCANRSRLLIYFDVEMPERKLLSREKKSSPKGTIAFVGLRAADVYLQYKLLEPSGWGTQLISSFGGGVNTMATTNPYTRLLLSLAAVTSLKHIIWMLFISEQEMPFQGAIVVCLFNSFCNCLCNLLAVWSTTSNIPKSSPLTNPTFAAGILLFAFGILLEIISELQRKSFKANPKNKGKPYGGGLFSLARHINYGGYTFWRVGYMMTTAGFTAGLATAAFFVFQFAAVSIPELDEYCSKRYGEAWKSFKGQTRWKLIPWIY
jgi:protein-S-isoprenylcysteine O-methyltransferase Ste14